MRKLILLTCFNFLFLLGHAQDSTARCGTPDMDTTEFKQLPWFDNNDMLEQ